jgi:two-component system sensor histidine kinase GlrK
MIARAEAPRQESGVAAASLSRLQRNPNSFLKLILLGFALVGLPLIVALVNSALSIDQLADQSRKAVYQAAQIAHSSRALADEIATMERAVRQTHILGDSSLLEGYFRAHQQFEDTAASLFELSLHTEQRQLLVRLQEQEASLFHKITLVRQSPEELRDLIGNFVTLRDSARAFSTL